jgi:hypothetical protein
VLQERLETCNTRNARSLETDRSEWFFRQSSLRPAKMLLLNGCSRTRDLRCELLMVYNGDIADKPQNRELQIMRIVRHPNIVELKAFYYSNGERVIKS